MTKQDKLTKIHDALIDYYSNSIPPKEFSRRFGATKNMDEIQDCIASSEVEWDALPCNTEGASDEQDADLEAHLNSTAQAVLGLINNTIAV